MAVVGCVVLLGPAGCEGPHTGGPGRTEPAPPETGIAADATPTDLEVGEPLERRPSPGETQEYRLGLEAGDYFELVVEQRGMDVAVSLFDPQGGPLLEVDLPIGDLGPERMMAVVDQAGGFSLRVKAWESEDPEGSYRVTLAARRPAAAADRMRSRAAELFFLGEREFWERRYGDAIAIYEQALEGWRSAGDVFWQSQTLNRQGNALKRLGELARATECYERSAVLLAGLDEPRFAAINANRLADLYFDRGLLEQAIQLHSRGLELRRQAGDRRGEGMALASLGDILKVQGETQRALEHFALALELFDRREDRQERATTLHNLGTLYRLLGKRQEALDRLEEAERIYADLGDVRRQASSLGQIGQLAFEMGSPDQALRLLRTSLGLRREAGDRQGQAATLRKIGSVSMAQGDYEGARLRYLQGLAHLQGIESPRTEAALLAELGSLNNRIDRGQEALGYHRRALAIFERVGDAAGRAGGLLGVAVSERQLGRPMAALQPAQQALEISEALRVKPLSEDLRLSFFSTAQRFFEFNIDLLMELDRIDPDAGHGAAALQVSERARARSLLDLLSEAGAEIRDDAAPGLLERERVLQWEINRGVALMEDEAADEQRRQAAAADVDRALGRLDTIRAAIRRESPRYAELTQPRPLAADEIRSRLLDDETALLEYRLGRQRSFLWVLTRDSFESFELGPAAAIEGSVRATHALLKQGWRRENEGQIRRLLCVLSRQLLEPAAGRLGRKRLAIVADGALEYLPFAALPDPDAPGWCLDAEPLVAGHEIVHLPSASTLAFLRQEARSRPVLPGAVAVMADPVFGVEDPRLGRSTPAPDGHDPSPDAALRGREPRLARQEFPRLPFSGQEAAAILDLAPAGRSFRALGFEASKQVVLAGGLAGYRVVHFATHGVLNSEQPALSSVVLSQVDPLGRPIDGFLRAHEIYNLRLPAELVVVSACETALGKQVRGEGLVGLTRGFMYAGAARVMVSLWQVSDRGTADLMTVFYEGLLQRGLSPPAALRAAQLEVRRRAPQPFYWAGFVVQGDW